MISPQDIEALQNLNVPIPKKEHERINMLRQCNLLDTPSEESYDRFTSLASRHFKTSIVLISLIDVERQWFKSRVGLSSCATSRNDAFCAYCILEEASRVMVIPDALEDHRFKSNPLVLGPPFIRFYAGASLLLDDVKIGTFCIIDQTPRNDFSWEDETCLIEIAECIISLIRDRRRCNLDTAINAMRMQYGVLKVFQEPIQFTCNEAARIKRLLDDAKYSSEGSCLSLQQMEELDAIVSRFQDHVKTCQMILEISVRSVCHLCQEQNPQDLSKILIYPFNREMLMSFVGRLQDLFELPDDAWQVECDISQSLLVESYFTLLLLSFVSVIELVHMEYNASPRRCEKCVCTVKLNQETGALILIVQMQRYLDSSTLEITSDPYLQALQIVLSWVGGVLYQNSSNQFVVSMFAKVDTYPELSCISEEKALDSPIVHRTHFKKYPQIELSKFKTDDEDLNELFVSKHCRKADGAIVCDRHTADQSILHTVWNAFMSSFSSFSNPSSRQKFQQSHQKVYALACPSTDIELSISEIPLVAEDRCEE